MNDSPPNAQTQRGRILELLRKGAGAWVPLPEILALGVAQYNARIFELRQAGFDIRNRTEIINGERHSWFSLAPINPKPEPVSDFMKRRREEEARENPLFSRGAA